MKATLRGRLAAALGITALVAVAITALVSVGLLRSFAERSAREDLRRLARAVATDPVGVPAGIGLARLQRVLQVSGDELALIGPDGSVAGTSPAAQAVAASIDTDALVPGSELEGSVRAAGEVYAYIAAVPAAIPGPLPPRTPTVVLARPIQITRELWVPMVGRIALAALAVVLLALAASSWVAGRLVKPVGALSAAAQRIARGDLEQRVPVEGDDELGDLARSFNVMSEALGEAQRREREFLATVSHELRTPITSIRGYAEAMQEGAIDGRGRDQALTIVLNEADRLERMIKDVMDLARLGARRFALEVAELDLRETLQDAVRAHRAQADAAGITLTDELPDDALVLATDPDRVRQIVSNLVENALRVAGEGDTITVRAARDGSTGGAVIQVSDTGPGIAAQDLPHVFERSYLWRASKGERPVGTGLGLAIVRELVTALGGRVEVTSELGQGSMFEVTLPARAPDA